LRRCAGSHSLEKARIVISGDDRLKATREIIFEVVVEIMMMFAMKIFADKLLSWNLVEFVRSKSSAFKKVFVMAFLLVDFLMDWLFDIYFVRALKIQN
jgi:hypothetical protein